MSINRSYAIFGLGRYGLSVARELVNNGADVLAVDQNQSIVNAAISDIPLCKCADITDPDVIRNLGLSNIDVVVIAMASNLEAAVMATMLCKEAGVKTVIVKCANEVHSKILSRVGADKVVIPEKESGTRLAKNLLSAGFIDVIELSEDVSLIELDVKTDWVGKTLIELNLRKKYGINVVAIRRGKEIAVSVDPEKPLTEEMKLLIIANTEKLSKLK
jgi:trk system potassium uptake protein TrkA